MTRHKVKITVIQAVEPETLYGDQIPINTGNNEPHVRCPIHQQGQEYTVTHNYQKPEGLCPGAWQDIRETVSVLHLGGTYHPWLAENEMIKCCTDGLRPVIFRLGDLSPSNDTALRHVQIYLPLPFLSRARKKLLIQ